LPEAASRLEAARAQARAAAELARARLPGAESALASLERERSAAAVLIAGGLAYRFFLWILPFGLVLTAIGSFWAKGDPEQFERTERAFGLTGAAAKSARTALESDVHGSLYLLLVGGVLLVWFGIGVVRALRLAHQIAWSEERQRLRRPVRSSLAFIGVVVAVAAVAAGTRWVDHATGEPLSLFATLAMLGVYAVVAAAAMSLLPHADAPFRALLPGAVLFAVGMQLVHVFVVLYLTPRLDSSSELYGALGVATVILLWLYIIARLTVSAAFLNATLWANRRPG
jgi:membrane protein